MKGAAIAILLLAMTHGVASGQQARPMPPDDSLRTTPLEVNRKGVYSGLQPGADTKEKPEKAARPPRRKNLVTWIGFQPQGDGGARVFLQLTSEVPYSQRVEDGRLLVHLEGARLANSNARRFLDTRFFDTALARVDADSVRRRRGRARGVELEIRFKAPADAAEGSASMTTSEVDGYTYLFVEFPPPSGGIAEGAEGGSGE